MSVIGNEMKGGGRIDIVAENNEWILKLYTKSGEIYQYKDKYSNVSEAIRLKKEFEKEAGDMGSLKLLYTGEDILWIKQ